LRFSGQIFENIFMVFLGSSCRETAKNTIKKNRWEKTEGKKFFLTFSAKKLFVVFLGSSCRETAKNAINKNRWEKTEGKKFFFSQLFRPEAFDMDFPQKVFNGVFELPLMRNALGEENPFLTWSD
jgi:hypothetical protein